MRWRIPWTPMKAPVTGLLGLFLTLSAGCSGTVVKVERRAPPAVLLEPCDRPEPGDLETGRDLAIYASRLDAALSYCAARMDAVRAFFDEPNEDITN